MRSIVIAFSIVVAELLLWLLLFKNSSGSHYKPELDRFVLFFPFLTPVVHIILALVSVKLHNKIARQVLQYSCYANCVVWPITIVCALFYIIYHSGKIGGG